jgi:hypothetical protein
MQRASPQGCSSRATVPDRLPDAPNADRPPPVRPGSDPSLAHLFGRLSVVEGRVSAAVAARRSVDPDPEDRFRGLYISDADVDTLLAHPDGHPPPPAPDARTADLLATVERSADEAESSGADLRLRRVGRTFGLDGLDMELLLLALAPDLDQRFERLYAYLQDDISRRRCSVGLALELCSSSYGSTAERLRLGPAGRLVAGGLILVEELDRPALTRPLRVPDRVTAHLLGDDAPDPTVAPVLTGWVRSDLPGLTELERVLAGGLTLCYLKEKAGAPGLSLAAAALSQIGLRPLTIDLSRLSQGEDPTELAVAAVRDARLLGGGLVAGPVEVLADRGPAAVRAFAEAECPVILLGSRGWDTMWSNRVPLLMEVAAPSIKERAGIWSNALNGSVPSAYEPETVTGQFRLTPEQVAKATVAARNQAAAQGRDLVVTDLLAGARAQNSAGLERLARRVQAKVAWDDLVLPNRVLNQLQELAARVRHRDRVLDDWGMGGKTSKGRGITALFAGDSGTGKTMSAEVVAGSLGLDLYVIDLSSVIDKYIGETEKNLDRIFVEADRVNGVLLFDEADALFGKRSDVKDSHDRYANVEVAYLLQRMELFDGLAILTTNLRSNVDEAFTRRLDSVIDFPMPEVQDRLALWRKNLKPGLPVEDDIDLDFLASAFKVSGGNIRNIAVAAAYLAAAEGRPVGMADLIRGTEGEYRKLGRMCVEAEFGPYFALVAIEPERVRLGSAGRPRP